MGNPLDDIFNQVADDLGWNNLDMSRNRPYDGQPHTCTGERGKQPIHGLTMRDIRDCFIRAYVLSHPYDKPGTLERVEPNATLIDEAQKGVDAILCESDIYQLVGGFDPMAIAQNLGCEIEKVMGIYPNVPGLKDREQQEKSR